MINILLIWLLAGLIGCISMSIQAKVRGHLFRDQLKRCLTPWWGIPALILCGIITLAVAAEKLESNDSN